MGLTLPYFAKWLTKQGLAANSFEHGNLPQSAWRLSLPVVPGYGVRQPGQILDKNGGVIRGRSGPITPRGGDEFYQEFVLMFSASRLRHPSRQEARRRPRSKTDTERERNERRRRTIDEIDQLYDEYLAALGPGPKPVTKGAVYARFSTRFQDSIADQVRTILSHAKKENIFVPRQLIFFDLAIRGFKKNRVGLDGVEHALRTKEASVLLLFMTSRLFRKQYRTLEFVDRMHKGIGIRCIFVKSGVDTNDTHRWQSILAFQSMLDQFVVTMNVANIQAAHEGLLKKQMVFGTLSFGYQGEPIPGEFTRQQRPRCRIAIDELTSGIVAKVFTWYVIDLVPISEIICRLNADATIPLPPRASSGMWTRTAVKNLLKNTRYRGLWRYGCTESVYVPDGDYVRQNMRAEPLAEVQIEELRVVSDELWFAAQARLQERKGNGGRRPKDGNHATRPKLFNGLLCCSEHTGQRLYTSGAYGHFMHCPICVRIRAEDRPLYSKLNRELTTELICQSLATLIGADPELPMLVLTACRHEAETVKDDNPKQLTQLKARVAQIGRSIDFTRQTVGESAEDQAEAERSVVTFQAERSKLQAEIARLGSASLQRPTMPTENEVRTMLANLAEMLVAASTSGGAEMTRARQVVELITGGVIELHQMGERKRRKGWLQARFRVSLVPYLVQKATGQPADCGDGSVEVTVDIVAPRDDHEMEEAWRLHKEGLLAKEIAQVMKCSRSKISKLLHAAAAKYNEPYIDGRVRRASLTKKQVEPPVREKIREGVMELYFDGWFKEDIAAHFNVSRNLITRIVRDWHVANGLAVPDGRSRRWHLAPASADSSGNSDE